jgi:hypothetical protein
MRTRPNVSLAPLPQRVRVRDFVHDLGRLMFPKTWKIGYIKYLSFREKTTGNTPVGSNEALVICDNLVEALKTGIAAAEVDVTAYAIDRIFPEQSKVNQDPTTASSAPEMGTTEDDEGEFDHLLRWPDEEEQGKRDEPSLRTPSAGFYAVSKKYWTEHYDPDDVNWERSTIQIRGASIRFWEIDAINKLRARGDAVEVPLYIRTPDRLLSTLFKMPPLLSSEEIQRYLDVKRSIWLEIIAATWRLLAINKTDGGEHGFQANLIKQLRNYMHIHGLADPDDTGFSEETMEAVVRNILSQWREKETNATVRVSSVANSVPSGRSKG